MGVILANSIEIGLGNRAGNFFYFNGFYVFEIALKISAYGFFTNQSSYLRDKWNILDFFAFTLTMIFDLILENSVNFMPLRLLRFVDYLEIKNIQYLLESLYHSLRFLMETFLIFMFFVFSAGIMSLHLFAGIFQKNVSKPKLDLN